METKNEPKTETKIDAPTPQKRPGNVRAAARMEAASLVRAGGGRASEPAIAAKLEEAGLPPSIAARMAREARTLAAAGRLPQPPAEPEPEPAPLSEADLEALSRAVHGLPGREPALLCAMFLCLRARPHPTGRIRYSDRELTECAGYLTAREYRRDFASLHSAGLVACAVVGSKEPTTTLSLPWAPPAPGPDEGTETASFAKGTGKGLAERLSGGEAR